MNEETKTDPNEALADEWAAALDEQDDDETGDAAATATFDELTDESGNDSVNMDAHPRCAGDDLHGDRAHQD